MVPIIPRPDTIRAPNHHPRITPRSVGPQSRVNLQKQIHRNLAPQTHLRAAIPRRSDPPQPAQFCRPRRHDSARGRVHSGASRVPVLRGWCGGVVCREAPVELAERRAQADDVSVDGDGGVEVAALEAEPGVEADDVPWGEVVGLVGLNGVAFFDGGALDGEGAVAGGGEAEFGA